jgi:hypothetical protein
MTKYRVSGEYTQSYELIIEASDEDTAMQIFYQEGGGAYPAKTGWNNLGVDFVNWQEDEPSHTDYTEKDYRPEGAKIKWESN